MDLKISELPLVSLPLNTTEVMPIVQNGVTKQVGVSSIGGDVYSSVVRLGYFGLGIDATDSDEVKKAAISAYLEGYNKNSKEVLFVSLYQENFTFTANANWSSVLVTDKDSFVTYLNNPNIIVDDFYLAGSDLRAGITSTATTLSMTGIGASFTDISGFDALEVLNLSNNSIIDLTFLSSLTNLTSLNLSQNSINAISGINSRLLTSIDLSFNSMTLADYTSSEAWASSILPFSSPCTMIFTNNTDSITGTNLEAILLTKNVIIVP